MRIFKGFFFGVSLVAVSLLSMTSCSNEAALPEVTRPAEIDADLTDADYIVVLRNDALLSQDISDRRLAIETRRSLMADEVTNVLSKAGVAEKGFTLVYVNAIKGASCFLTAEEAVRLSARPEVLMLQKVREMKVPTIMESEGEEEDDVFPSARAGQALPWGIRRVGGAADGTGKTAWILDTGIDLDHPDLLVDTDRAVSFIPGESPDDGFGHGSHVAGTVAAIDNNFGVIGVAAGATVVPVKVLSNFGSGTDAQVIGGIDYVMENFTPGDVANMSLGGSVSLVLDEAVLNAADAGVIFVLAAGNGNIFGIAQNAANTSPARVNHENVYTISAINKFNGLTIFSNYSATIIDYAAPGLRIASCYKNGGYRVFDGTSMAAPHVTGLLLSGGINPLYRVLYDWDNNKDWVARR